MMTMLYQVLKILPTICGSSGAKATISNACRFNGSVLRCFSAASMAENNREESNARATSLFPVRARVPESLSFFQKRIRDRPARTCHPDDLAEYNADAIP